MTFIKDFSKYIMEKYPTNKDWADLCALTAIASVVSRDTAIYTKMGGMRLNLFSLNIGPSRLAYKSTPLKYCLVPTLYNLGENLGKRFLLPSRYSMEGLIEYMNEFSSQGCIVRDEFTTQFKDVRNKKYLAEGMEFLSELYDGLLQIRYTKSSKLEEVTKVYVSYIGATTPYIFTVMPRDFFIQGTGNRYLFVFSEPDENEVLKFDKSYSMDYNDMVEVESEHIEFAQRLAIIRESAPQYINISLGGAQELLSRFSQRMTKKAFVLYGEDVTDIRYSYYANLKEFVLKIAAINCLSRNEPMYETFNENQLQVIEKDMAYAINKVKIHLQYFDKLMDAWSAIAQRTPVTTSKSDFDYIVSIIKLNGGKISTKDLWKQTGYDWHKFQRIINAMVAGEVIVGKEESTGKPGRKPLFYHVT